ncbi:DVU_1557 family redox protein [Desulfitobacterium hafniense]|uniref:DVU_1557 family redox protein n=1 Tax=Desulfitobacterium hafniense TaxID=49338 RepID=UPI0002F10552|nr:CLJU_RS11820 family redox protein [Desulfitobacterium hafniense]
MNQSKDEIICEKCRVHLVSTKTKLMYQGVRFDAELLKCPKCGQAFVSEELAQGKFHEIEIALEDK